MVDVKSEADIHLAHEIREVREVEPRLLKTPSALRISWVRLETPRGESKHQKGHTKLRCRQNGKSQGHSVNVGKARLVTARAERPVFTQI